MPLRGILLITIFLGSVPICFFRPIYGILLWTVVAFLNPQAFIWDAVDLLPWALIVAVPTMLGGLVFARGWHKVFSGRSLLLCVLWLWFSLTTLQSTSTPEFMHHANDTWAKWLFVSKILMMTVVTIVVVDTFPRLRLFVLVIAGCFGVYVAKSFPFIIASGGAFRLYGPPKSMIADNNDFGLALNMTLPLYFFLAQTESKRWVRRLFAGLFLITVPAVFFTYSRGALVGLVAVSFLMFIQLKQRLLLIPVIALGVALAVLFAPSAWKQRMDPTRPDAIDGSARERLNAWTFAWNLSNDYPVFGGGFATFTPRLFAQYAPVALDIHGAHSVYFGVLAEHGFVGLVLYFILIASCFIGARRLIREAESYHDTDVIAYANMFRFSIVAFLASGLFLGRAYFDYYFSIVAALTVLEHVARRKWELIDADEPAMVPLATEFVQTPLVSS